METLSSEKETNTENFLSDKDSALKHLAPGISPIMACIGTRKDFEKEPGLTKHLNYGGEDSQTLLVDYYGHPYENEWKGISDAGEETYAISGISNLNKFSLRYKNCMGIVVTGQDKETGKNISFFSHQNPRKILPEGAVRERFVSDIRKRLKEMNERCVSGTIDAVIFGGNYLDSDEWEKKLRVKGLAFEKNYKDSIQLLSEEISGTLGFQPTVIAGPKTVGGGDDVIYDNENRRLYVRRPEIGETSSESFSPEKMEEREERWRKEWK